jgi:4-aminobutyrate aminotransferase
VGRDDGVAAAVNLEHDLDLDLGGQGSPAPEDPELARRYAAVIAPALAHYSPLVVERAQGAYLYTSGGGRYLDLGSGIATTNLGHSHPEVVAAVEAQLHRVTHLSITAYHEAPVALAEHLVRVAPPGLEMVFFGNSGAEAVEGTLKLARRVTGRSAVVAFLGGFHGRTFGALSVTSSRAAYRAGYAPLLPGVYLAPYPASSAEAEAEACLAHLDRLFALAVPPEEVAAILVEPVQAEGGIVVPPPAFLHGLRERCDRHGIVLIFDEVQTGFGRTGAMFAAQRWGVTPDVMAVGKAIASGLPLSAVVGRRDLMAAWPEGSHGTTFGGNLLACAAGVATLAVLEREGLPERARELGAWALDELRAVAARHPRVAVEARGLGLLLGLACTGPEVVHRVERRLLAEGILALHCGPAGEVLRFLPPLTVERDDLGRAITAVDRALAGV